MLTPETEGHIAVAVWPGDRVVENNGVLGRNALRRQKGRNDDRGSGRRGEEKRKEGRRERVEGKQRGGRKRESIK